MKTACLFFLILLAGVKVQAGLLTNSVASGAVLTWGYPTNCITDDLSFQVYGSKDVTIPWTNWNLLTNIFATNLGPLQVAFDGSNWMATNLAVRLDLQPDRYFFVMTASNFWGGTGMTSSMCATPPAPLIINNLKLRKGP